MLVDVDELIAQGFDATTLDDETGRVSVGCSQCEVALCGTEFRHELVCPNRKAA